MDKDRKLKRRFGILAAVALMASPLYLPAARSAAHQSPETVSFSPQIPDADRSDENRVFLEHADVLHKQTRDSFMILSGNVEFTRGGMIMKCDSAHYYPESESMFAFGNVSMEQGDTLFIYADEMQFRNYEQMAYLFADFGNTVRMINRDVELTTPSFAYDLHLELGYYTEGGTLNDKSNELISRYGEYNTTTKVSFFIDDVLLKSLTKPDSIIADTLVYNTETHVAELFTDTQIFDKDGTIYTDFGIYNTETNIANLYRRSKVVMKQNGTTLEGDTLFYDRNAGYGEAFGNMVLTDTADCSILSGDYGYYNEITDSAFVTGRALAREYSQGDTLYLHGRYIYSFARTDTVLIPADTLVGRAEAVRVDTNHVLVAHPRVRFFRSDMQGVCDSMRFEEKDSVLYMYRHPIIWSDERQIFGNVIQLHMNDSTIESAKLPDFGFSAELVDEDFYNQLSGKEMVALFRDGEMHHLDVNGNVEAIMLPMENDSTYNKIINVESSFLSADFEARKLLRMKMWPETSGTVTPLYLAKKSLFRLPKFRWYTGMRPESPEDVFNIPEEMDALMSDRSDPVPSRKTLSR